MTGVGGNWRAVIGSAALAAVIAIAPPICFAGLAAAANHEAPQVWYAPDNDSPDLLEMFRQPALWRGARSKISVFKFGPQQLCCTGPELINSVSDLRAVNAFGLLQLWGISIALEAPAVKEWDCTGEKAAQATLDLIGRARAAGGIIRYLSMDEPLRSGMGDCGGTMNDSARKTASYMRRIRKDELAVGIGDIEPYPGFSVADLEQWLTVLAQNGADLDHFHLDVNVHYLDVHPEINFAQDLRATRDFLNSRNIPFGVIFWSGYDPEPSDQAFFDRTLAWVKHVHEAIGVPDQAIFQSWVTRSYPGCSDTDTRCVLPKIVCPPDAPGCGRKSVPVNLPDNSARVFSLTELVNDGLAILQK
jgi:hypothetical protein